MIYRPTRRIGLVGLTHSGKTTFITSLLDHWNSHDRQRFSLGKKSHDICIEWLGKPHENGKHRYRIHRSSIAFGKWLPKTLECERYDVRVHSSAWKLFSTDVTLFDIPGERLADVDMLRFRSLIDWSKETNNRLRLGSLNQISGEFQKVFDRSATPSVQWLEALEGSYRDVVAQLLKDRNPFITPSSVLVDAQGNYVPEAYLNGKKDITQWVTKHSTFGIGEHAIFPIPEAFTGSKLLHDKQKQYRKYCKKVVWPALATLSSCQEVVVLVDVAAILSMGTNWKNQTSEFLKSLIRQIVVKSKTAKWCTDTVFYGTAGFAGRRVEKITFVASQADRVHMDDHDSLLLLLQELVRDSIKVVRGSNLASTDYEVAAAVNSTECGPDHSMRFMQDGAPNGAMLVASQIPASFPNDWDHNEYSFPLPSPRIPKNTGNPPRQFGLEHITERILNLS